MPSRWPRRIARGVLAAVLVAAPACGSANHPAQPASRPSVSASASTPSAVPPTPTASPTVPATPTPAPSPQTLTPAACTAAGVLAAWSLQRLAGQTVAVPVQESDVSAVNAEVAAGAGGVLLFGSQAPSNLGAALAALAARAPGGIAPLVMTDEEGGVIQRMADLAGSMPSAREMGATMTPAQIQALATQVGQRMKAAGVTMNLAPVLDLDSGPGPSDADPDGTRSFSADASVATADGLAFAAGMRAAGVVAVAKHFPGLGGATANPDASTASTLPWSVLQDGGLLPYRSAIAAGIPAVMVADANVPGLTTLPAALSPTVVTGVLRTQLGFSGLVLTDSLSAVSVSAAGYSVPQASAAALAAGADMVLFNGDAAAIPALTAQTVQAVVAAVQSGRLSRSRLETAVLHILTAKHVALCP